MVATYSMASAGLSDGCNLGESGPEEPGDSTRRKAKSGPSSSSMWSTSRTLNALGLLFRSSRRKSTRAAIRVLRSGQPLLKTNDRPAAVTLRAANSEATWRLVTTTSSPISQPVPSQVKSGLLSTSMRPTEGMTRRMADRMVALLSRGSQIAASAPSIL